MNIDAVADAIKREANVYLSQEQYRRMAQAAISVLQLTPEFGWDVAGRKKPNPHRIYGNDGRPVTDQPDPAGYVRLYGRLTSPWVRVGDTNETALQGLPDSR